MVVFQGFAGGLRSEGGEAEEPQGEGEGGTLFDKDTPIVGTCSQTIQYLLKDGRRVTVHDGETRQMNSGVTYVYMPQTLPEGR